MKISYNDNILFQVVSGFVMGLFFGPFSWGIMYTLAYVFLFEAYVMISTRYYPPPVRVVDRLLINVFFFAGWFLSRFLVLDECLFKSSS